MGTANIPAAADGTPIPASDHNAIANALKGDLVPRNGSGNAQAESGSLGTDTYPFYDAKVMRGYFFPGQVVLVHDFNGALQPGQGWMKLNGDVVNEANYDAQHTAGDWDKYIIASPLAGKNLPNMNEKYARGKTNTTQTGAAPITTVGNANHQVGVPHAHNVNGHNHAWAATAGGGGGIDGVAALKNTTWDGAGNNANLAAIGTAYTSISGGTTDVQNPVINVSPESVEFEYWIRII